jgi:hypothetical protein
MNVLIYCTQHIVIAFECRMGIKTQLDVLLNLLSL